MVTIVLLVIWVCGTVPKNKKDSFFLKKIHVDQKLSFDFFVTKSQLTTEKRPLPIVVVEGTVFVATIGATVAAATGVTGLKIGFCEEQKLRTPVYITALND